MGYSSSRYSKQDLPQRPGQHQFPQDNSKSKPQFRGHEHRSKGYSSSNCDTNQYLPQDNSRNKPQFPSHEHTSKGKEQYEDQRSIVEGSKGQEQHRSQKHLPNSGHQLKTSGSQEKSWFSSQDLSTRHNHVACQGDTHAREHLGHLIVHVVHHVLCRTKRGPPPWTEPTERHVWAYWRYIGWCL